jgi:hypothetical protein
MSRSCQKRTTIKKYNYHPSSSTAAAAAAAAEDSSSSKKSDVSSEEEEVTAGGGTIAITTSAKSAADAATSSSTTGFSFILLPTLLFKFTIVLIVKFATDVVVYPVLYLWRWARLGKKKIERGLVRLLFGRRRQLVSPTWALI